MKMEELQRHKWRLLALGGACAATAALVFLAKKRNKRGVGSPQKAAPKKASASKPIGSKASSASENLTRKSFPGWVAQLGKKESDELPTLLEWTDRLLDEKPQDAETLGVCLNLMQHLVLGNSTPAYLCRSKMASEVSEVALKAKTFAPERCLEILVNLFKDKHGRGHVADSCVIDYALSTMKDAIKGTSSRPVYHRACRLLYFLSPEPSNRQKIVKAGGLDVVLQMMEKFQDDTGVLLESCHTLRLLVGEPSLDKARAFEAAMRCLAEKNSAVCELQMRALSVIHALPQLPGSEMKVAKLAVAAAKKHPRQDGVIEWVAKVLHMLCKVKNSEVKAWLKSDECRNWLETFWESPKAIKKPNKELDFWVAELCQLCGT